MLYYVPNPDVTNTICIIYYNSTQKAIEPDKLKSVTCQINQYAKAYLFMYVSVVDPSLQLYSLKRVPLMMKSRLLSKKLTTMKGVLGNTEDSIVSTDFVGENKSSTFDATAGIQLSPKLVDLAARYIN